MKIKSIAVFCGSTDGKETLYSQKAENLGRLLAENSITLVYGGGNRGLMGRVAHSVFNNGGEVIGVLPEAMNIASVTNGALHTRLEIVRDMHERKKRMYELSDAFIALPGGIGTIEEIMEIFTWKQLGYHNKNVSLLNIAHYWDSLLGNLQRGVSDGFINERVLRSLIVEDDEKRLLERLNEESIALPSKL